MKKAFVAIVVVTVIGLLCFLVVTPIVNDYMARKTANELVVLPLPGDTEYIESVYKAGKLVGNGNGMQYFGAILIKSERSLEELAEYYSSFAENEWECVVENQTDATIKVIEHGKLAFKTDVEGDKYYIVYTWGEHYNFFSEFDVRAH